MLNIKKLAISGLAALSLQVTISGEQAAMADLWSDWQTN